MRYSTTQYSESAQEFRFLDASGRPVVIVRGAFADTLGVTVYNLGVLDASGGRVRDYLQGVEDMISAIDTGRHIEFINQEAL